MMPQKRTPAPDCLIEKRKTTKWGQVENQEKWGKQYAAKLNDSQKQNDFQWATYKTQRVNKILEPLLCAITQNHCSFCDIFPLQQSGGTIEHFKPKKQFPLLSHTWENLFYCCHKCQEKGEKFDSNLLKPDELTYLFDDFFICTTQDERIMIVPNPRADVSDQQRAVITIELYGLNSFGRPEARWLVLNQFQDSKNPILDDFAYRYLF
jgi:uncharacterized protein (TIGR02646 family)